MQRLLVAPRIFISHSSTDAEVCKALTNALRAAGADVWYDDDDLRPGLLVDSIQREIGSRPIFIVLLSPAAIASAWVRRECLWAYEQMIRDPTHIILPIAVGTVSSEDFTGENGWLFLGGFKRIQAPSGQSFTRKELRDRVLSLLELPQVADQQKTLSSRLTGEDLIEQSKALIAQQAYSAALAILQRVVRDDAHSFSAWLLMSHVWYRLQRFDDALAAVKHATALRPQSAAAWNNCGNILRVLHRYSESLQAYDQALHVDVMGADIWRNKALLLRQMGDHAAAEVAEATAAQLQQHDQVPLKPRSS